MSKPLNTVLVSAIEQAQSRAIGLLNNFVNTLSFASTSPFTKRNTAPQCRSCFEQASSGVVRCDFPLSRRSSVIGQLPVNSGVSKS